MISTELEGKILRLHNNDKWPIGTIATHLRVHHSVVRRVLGQLNVESVPRAIRPSIADAFLPLIRTELEKYPDLTASRLYRMCKERGYQGAPDHFRTVVRGCRPRRQSEAFSRLSTLPGEQGQVDWAHFGRMKVGRIERPLVAFVLVLSQSRMIFLSFHLTQETGVFLAAHEAAFAALGGVPRVLLYDNLKSAVLERVGDHIRMNERMLAFAAHHRFEARPVGVRKGNEKGRVERAIQYVRSSFFAGTTFADLADVNAKAAEWCALVAASRRHQGDATLSVMQAWEKERKMLLPLPADRFPTHTPIGVRIGKTPYARVDGNDYTVPHAHVQRELTAFLTEKEILFSSEGTVVARHDRSWGRGERVENPEHLSALWEQKRRSHAASATERLQALAPASRDFLEQMHREGNNIGGIVTSLSTCLDQYGPTSVQKAISLVLVSTRVSLAHVRQQLDRISVEAGRSAHITHVGQGDPRLKGQHVTPQSLSAWDGLGRSKE